MAAALFWAPGPGSYVLRRCKSPYCQWVAGLGVRVSVSYQLMAARMSVRVPRRPDAGVPVHAGDHSALPVQDHGPAVPSEQFPQRVEAGAKHLAEASLHCSLDRTDWL
jgi:hypothetical protein